MSLSSEYESAVEFQGEEGPVGGLPAELSGGEDVARARTSFLVEESVPAGVVRKPILASWFRSRSWRVRPDRLELPFQPEVDNETLLTRAAEPVLRDVADLFTTEPVSVILCDAQGVVLSRRTGDSGLEHHLNRVWLAPGFSYAESYVGTNGIGTALEARGPAQVYGHEHYIDRLEELACAGVPVRHPTTGKVLGVVDLTCWRRDAGPFMLATAATLARRIEESLQHNAGEWERAVLSDYLSACRRSRGPVLALADDLLMMNDRARECLDPADHAPLLAQAREALMAQSRHPLLIDLPSGRVARVHCRPTVSRGGVVGGVVDVQLVAETPVPDLASQVPPPRRAAVAVGSSAAWLKCVQAVDRCHRTREWLVLEGEPGSGRQTLVRAAHQGRSPAAGLYVFRSQDHGPSWFADIADELATNHGTVVVTDIDQLPAAAVEELADVLHPYQESTDPGRPWVVATVTRSQSDGAPDLSALLSCFPGTVVVPPLRHHVEDVAELVPHLLGRLGHGARLSCSPEALRVLMRYRWPGNTGQLLSVLRKIVAKRRAGSIQVHDLPPECRVTTRRVLTPLESLECDAIVEALLDTGGNKVEAARRLSMSRATIYRKIRDYGITVPGPGRPDGVR